MNQYLCRLAHNWSFASARSEITIFDQAFVQAVYSLAESNGCPLQLDNALSLIPIPDILIGLSISKEELSRRLGERRQRQGRLERLLETSPAKNVASVEIFASLDERLGKRGIRVIKIGTDGPHDVDAAARSIAETIQTVTRRTPETVAG
jgi:thymidylate kinase